MRPVGDRYRAAMVDGVSDTVWCVVVAAGSGSRFGGPKHLADLGGSTVLERSVATASAIFCALSGEDSSTGSKAPEMAACSAMVRA